MGLDCSHGAFNGAYSSFNRLRQVVCASLGPDGSYPPHFKRTDNGQISLGPNERILYDTKLDNGHFYVPDEYTRDKFPGLHEFLEHSDCDGEISPEMCAKVANDLEGLLPKVLELGWTEGGHIERNGGYVKVLETFIAGCRAAAAVGEPLEFS